MKFIRLLPLIFVVSCGPSFDKNYYERVTNIKFPADYKVVATADNAEFVTITILDLNKTTCRQFIQENKFQPLDTSMKKYFKYWRPELTGMVWLDTTFRHLPDNNLLQNTKSKQPGDVGWTYYIDTLNCRLYCQINYPDAGGN